MRGSLATLGDTFGELERVTVTLGEKSHILLVPAAVKASCSAKDVYENFPADYNVLTMLTEFALDKKYGCAEGTTDDDLPGSIGRKILQTIAASDAGVYAQFLLAMYALPLKHSIEGPAGSAALPHNIDSGEETHPLVIIYTAAIKHRLPEAIAYLKKLFAQLSSSERVDWIAWDTINSSAVNENLIRQYERPVGLYLGHYRS